MKSSSSPIICMLWLLSFAATSLVSVKASLTEKSANSANNNLVVFPLLPGDSTEARRRRRELRGRRQRQRRNLRQRRTENEKDEEETEDGADASPEENPLDLRGDALYEGYGVHYVDVWVGAPKPQRQTVIVDTGSSVTGFPCTGCEHCGGSIDEEGERYHTDNVFQKDDSETFEVVTSEDQCMIGSWQESNKSCRTSRHYSEGSSWNAFEAIDTVYTGGDHAFADSERVEKASFRLHFGCQDKVTGLFEMQLADGIMGLYNSRVSFWHQMYEEKKIEQRAFSLCFSEPGHVDRTGTPAGAMVLGGSDTRLHKTPMTYAQQMKDDGKYVLHLEKVYLLEPQTGEKTEVQQQQQQPEVDQYHKVVIFEEDLNNGPVILDSGTTATYLTKQLQRRFVQVFNSLVPEDLMVYDPDAESYELTLAQVKQLPTIVFQMKGWMPEDDEEEPEVPSVTTLPGRVGTDIDPQHAGKSIMVEMPPSSYLARVEDNDEIDLNDEGEVATFRFNVYFTKKKGSGGVLGANFMRGLDVLFDIDNSRIGFAKSDCEFTALANDEDSG